MLRVVVSWIALGVGWASGEGLEEVLGRVLGEVS